MASSVFGKPAQVSRKLGNDYTALAQIDCGVLFVHFCQMTTALWQVEHRPVGKALAYYRKTSFSDNPFEGCFGNSFTDISLVPVDQGGGGAQARGAPGRLNPGHSAYNFLSQLVIISL